MLRFQSFFNQSLHHNRYLDYFVHFPIFRLILINNFIINKNLNAQKIAEDFDKKWHRHDLVTAIIGKPNNRYRLKIKDY